MRAVWNLTGTMSGAAVLVWGHPPRQLCPVLQYDQFPMATTEVHDALPVGLRQTLNGAIEVSAP